MVLRGTITPAVETAVTDLPSLFRVCILIQIYLGNMSDVFSKKNNWKTGTLLAEVRTGVGHSSAEPGGRDEKAKCLSSVAGVGCHATIVQESNPGYCHPFQVVLR